MPKNPNKSFSIGTVTVEVFTADGASAIEDWAAEDAEEALEYARETSCCADVVKVEYRFGTTIKTFCEMKLATA